MTIAELLVHPFFIMGGAVSGSAVISIIGWYVTRRNSSASLKDLKGKVSVKPCKEAMERVDYQIKNKVEKQVCVEIREKIDERFESLNNRFSTVEDRLERIETSSSKQLAALSFLVGKHSDGNPKTLGLED